jgi:hypothetical protein
MSSGMGHLKKQCAGCERKSIPMNKEHVFPEWLILRTGTQQTGIRWGHKHDVPALAVTLPLCVKCNDDFGRELESPTSVLFDDIENGRGLSDDDAELLIRWMWKTMGLLWVACNPGGRYSAKYTLRQRVLLPIDEIRPRLILGVALFKKLHPHSKDLPMGLDSPMLLDAIFVSGVFSRIALMVVLDAFEDMIPRKFGRYRLARRRNSLVAGKYFYPPTSFQDDYEAVQVTQRASVDLCEAHESFALNVAKQSSRSPERRRG